MASRPGGTQGDTDITWKYSPMPWYTSSTDARLTSYDEAVVRRRYVLYKEPDDLCILKLPNRCWVIRYAVETCMLAHTMDTPEK